MIVIDQALVDRDLPRGTRERFRLTAYCDADPSALTVEISLTPEGTHAYDWKPAAWVSSRLDTSRGQWVAVAETVAAIDTAQLVGDRFTVHLRPTSPGDAKIRPAWMLNLI